MTKPLFNHKEMKREELIQNINNDIESATWEQLGELMDFAWYRMSCIQRAGLYVLRLKRVMEHTEETEKFIEQLYDSVHEDASIYSDFYNRIGAEKDKRARGILRKYKKEEKKKSSNEDGNERTNGMD